MEHERDRDVHSDVHDAGHRYPRVFMRRLFAGGMCWYISRAPLLCVANVGLIVLPIDV